MTELEANKQWIAQWKRTGPILERLRHAELRAMTEEESALALSMLSEFALSLPDHLPRTTSGLVEQQRLFSKLKKHGSTA